jgi:ABC-type amino acid transport substrate-binding protein
VGGGRKKWRVAVPQIFARRPGEAEVRADASTSGVFSTSGKYSISGTPLQLCAPSDYLVHIYCRACVARVPVGRTPEREEIFDFTFPYMSLHGAIMVREGEDDIQRLEDLIGRQVAVMKSDNTEEFLRREDRAIEIRTTATFEQALRQLSEGLHDAVVIQRLVAVRLIEEHGLRNLRIVERPLKGFRQDFCFAVREGDRETLALLNEGLSLVMADGTYRHLHARWFAALQLPEHRRLVIGGDHDFPPFEYLDETGQPSGHNVELTEAIAEAMDLDVEIRLGPWPEMREALERGEIDALQGMFYSTERELLYDFTPPFTRPRSARWAVMKRRRTGRGAA